jgi:CheY-like chemotaxis protein
MDKPIKGYDDVKEGDYVALTVSDTGVGISKEDQKHIFEPFYTKKVMGRSGTGLGMSVVWATVKDHKGYIDISSRKGHGTSVTLYFPVTKKEKISQIETVSMKEFMGKGESILVVDDISEQREIANLMLTKLGYQVTTVASGEAAVEHLKAQAVDLVILDMIMDPGMDGLDTYEEIIKLHPGQKAIIVSGYSESERVKKAQNLGVGAYVKKPYVLRDIGAAARNELDR